MKLVFLHDYMYPLFYGGLILLLLSIAFLLILQFTKYCNSYKDEKDTESEKQNAGIKKVFKVWNIREIFNNAYQIKDIKNDEQESIGSHKQPEYFTDNLPDTLEHIDTLSQDKDGNQPNANRTLLSTSPPVSPSPSKEKGKK